MTGRTSRRSEPRGSRTSETFNLLGEVLWTGVLVAVASVPIVTMPAALAAGIRHLQRHIDAREDGIRLFLRDFRAALLPGGVGVGVAVAALSAALAVQPAVSIISGVPGAELLGVASGLLLWMLWTLSVAACANWSPERPWRSAIVEGAARWVTEPRGGALVALAVALTAVATWQLPPLLVPSLGCLAFAMVAVSSGRRRRTRMGARARL